MTGTKQIDTMTDTKTHIANVKDQGYSLIKGAFPAQVADMIGAELSRLEEELEVKPHGNSFEGEKTVRIYNLLKHGPLFQAIPIQETVLPVVEGVLDEGCLISSLSSISICPGESAQPLHGDDQVIGIRVAERPLVCNTMWAITDFTNENGATRLVPKSHTEPGWPDYFKQDDIETIPAEMEKGDVLIWNGALWHDGGANQTNERRIGIAMNYCAGFIRQQENQLLGVPFELAEQFPQRLQELMGYGTYKNLIGHINRESPLSLFGDYEQKTIWDLSDG